MSSDENILTARAEAVVPSSIQGLVLQKSTLLGPNLSIFGRLSIPALRTTDLGLSENKLNKDNWDKEVIKEAS